MNKTRKGLIIDYALIAICSVCIIVSGIITRQMVIKMLPALISLVVTAFIAKANRLGFLLGSLNSVLYAIGFTIERLYASVFQVIVFGGILQFIAFINWGKNTNKKSVNLRKMKFLHWVVSCLIVGAIYTIAHIYNVLLGGSNIFFDSFIVATGIMVTLLSMLRFVESQIFSCINNFVNLIMWIVISISNISNITYVIIGLYTLYRAIQGLVLWYRKVKDNENSSLVNSENVVV
jgi:nicotinamide mononucleotide transporter PnuC